MAEKATCSIDVEIGEIESLSVEVESGNAINVEIQQLQGGGGGKDAVLYVEQELTEEQQAQARKNIGAIATSEEIVAALGYTPADQTSIENIEKDVDELSKNNRGEYVFTGIREHIADETYHVTLNDDYSWETLTSAAYDHKNIGCVIWDDNREYPVYLTFAIGYFGDGYAVFTALDEYGYAWEMQTYPTGATLRNYNIRGGQSDATAKSYYTELSRRKVDGDKVVCVTCHGLTAGESYNLHLYTSARRRGTSQDPWRHPSNENTGEGYTGKGYANLVGLRYGNNPGLVYPDVPSWMPRGGILQTEWTFTAEKETHKFEINIGTWLVPLLKPVMADFDLDEYALIGVSAKAIAPLLFQFRLVKDGTVGDCRNTLCVGLAKVKHGDVWTPGTIKNVSTTPPEIDTSYLYTSIR